jgi:3-phenylpropionate/cinnamic acid dioxygenase small subunit
MSNIRVAMTGVFFAAALMWLRPAALDAATPKLSGDDYIQIQQLYANYAHALDTGQAERFAATFVDDGEFTGGRGPGRGADARTPLKGHDALLAMGGRGGSRHFVANLVINPAPGGAKASCYLLLFDVHKSPATMVETAIYDDTLVKTAKGWKFKKRVVWRDDDDISPFKPKPVAPAAAAPATAPAEPAR